MSEAHYRCGNRSTGCLPEVAIDGATSHSGTSSLKEPNK